ncbi:FadR/GntR family transcriptional regulator [Desulfovibrio inopinatus]|uniref:FadR/GntR family transcriptional regulator n=1 Tax=Desulfovibrio inopinatus TaxID=102109 RepID=UPI0004126B17|nr:FadR/GntR family transcriptional regulator [Desulfovibrio inopinatus]
MKCNPPKLQRRRLSDQIIENLLAMIANGDLKAGDKLPPEPRLMEQFEVGRSSIREAIGALELLGLVSVRPGHGTVVTDATDTLGSRSVGLSLITIGHEKIQELVEARSELEQTMVKLAAERATETDIATIQKEHHKLTQAKQSGRKRIAADLAFHNAVAIASHNSILLRLYSELRQPVRHWMEQKTKFNWGYNRVIEEHESILHAIATHDIDAAQAAMKVHIEDAGKKLVAALSEIDTGDSLE